MLKNALAELGLATPEQRAWAMYDWANSAHSTVITAAVLPPFFASYYASSLTSQEATAVYGVLASLAILVAALASPVLGALADCSARKKEFLAGFTALGVLATGLLFFVPAGRWGWAASLTALSGMGMGCALVFYEGLLPHIAREDELDRVSSAGYALGYVGGGLLLAINIFWIMRPEWFGMADSTVATRWSLFSVAVWWAVFSIPVLRRVPEPPALTAPAGTTRVEMARLSFVRLGGTFREIRAYRDLFVFLLAFWFYNDGIGTIIKMATLYGHGIGIGMIHLILALLITQFVAFPFSFFFGSLGTRWGPVRGLQLALGVYCGIVVLGCLMARPWHFFALAILVGTVQGGAQSLSRSLFARLAPKCMTGEFFGFFSVSSKFATVLGPLVFAAVTYLTQTSRLAILSLLVFFAVGLILLQKVDVARGQSRARAVDERARGGPMENTAETL